MNPFFITGTKPYLESGRYGVALINPTGTQIVAYWGPRAQPGKCSWAVYGTDGMKMEHHAYMMRKTFAEGRDPSAVHWISNHDGTNEPLVYGGSHRGPDGNIVICEEAQHFDPTKYAQLQRQQLVSVLPPQQSDDETMSHLFARVGLGNVNEANYEQMD